MKNLFLLLTLLTSLLKAQDIAVVASNSFDATKLSKAEIKRIFLSKTNYINNKRIHVLEIKNTSYKRDFYKKVSGKSPVQLRSYWTTLIFTGKAQPPKQIKDMQELIQLLLKDSKAISYIPLDAVTKDMKVLYTMKE